MSSNRRLVDTAQSVAIKPFASKKPLVIEELDISLDEYLDSLGLDDDSIAPKKTPPPTPLEAEPEDL